MKFTLSWLSNFVSLEGIDAAQLSDKLTMLGLEVDAVEELFTGLDEIITCRVLSTKKHPNADKLTLCEVDTGNETLEIVCGAPNVREGLVTAIARPGVQLPDGTKIKKAKVRGQVSYGMLCSSRELGLSDEHSGILELDENVGLGKPFATTMNLRDTVIEVDLTPNRPDCASVLGIAREVAGFTKQQVKLPFTDINPLQGKNLEYKVSIEEPDLCPRYTARRLTGVSIAPSPAWMQQQLIAVGMRPINNIVDITNFVMLELGQPLHAFDYNTLKGKSIVVRCPKDTETKFKTLDGQERQLQPEMLMICDNEEPVAVAGVMGGFDSEVTDTTTEILLESACFNPVSIRKTARTLNLPSESSYRFERGVDPELAPKAMERAVQLMVEYAGATPDPEGIDVYPGKEEPLILDLRADRVCSLLGISVSEEEIGEYLRGIEFGIETSGTGVLKVVVPSFRIDIEREVDLVEEVARLVGYNDIPTSQPKISMESPKQDRLRTQRHKLGDFFTGQGFYEAINYSFVSEKHLEAFRLDESDYRRNVTRLLNPLTEDQAIMRSMLLPGLLENIKHNINYQQADIRLFEIGKVFIQEESGSQPRETNYLCAVICGKRYPAAESLYFSGNNADFFDIKGVAENTLHALRITGSKNEISFKPVSEEESVEPYSDPACSVQITDENNVIGSLGRIHPKVLESFGIKQEVFYLELNLEKLNSLPKIEKKFVPLPKFPAVKRDIALVVPDYIPAGQVLQTVHDQKQKLVESVELFDVYQGKPIAEGMKSVALSVTYRSDSKTLQDKAVDKVHQKIVNSLMTQFKASYREGSEA